MNEILSEMQRIQAENYDLGISVIASKSECCIKLYNNGMRWCFLTHEAGDWRVYKQRILNVIAELRKQQTEAAERERIINENQ